MNRVCSSGGPRKPQFRALRGPFQVGSVIRHDESLYNSVFAHHATALPPRTCVVGSNLPAKTQTGITSYSLTRTSYGLNPFCSLSKFSMDRVNGIKCRGLIGNVRQRRLPNEERFPLWEIGSQGQRSALSPRLGLGSHEKQHPASKHCQPSLSNYYQEFSPSGALPGFQLPYPYYPQEDTIGMVGTHLKKCSSHSTRCSARP
jgi:hypothetical protein